MLALGRRCSRLGIRRLLSPPRVDPNLEVDRFHPSASEEFIMFGLGTQELLIFLVIAMLLFGSAKLPSLMRNLGRSAKEFKQGMKDDVEGESDSDKQGKHDPIA